MTTQARNGQALGVTISSFCSVSLEPPLVLFCLGKNTSNLDAYAASSCFAVNVLAESQMDLSENFARQSDDKFQGISFQKGKNGCPDVDLDADIEADGSPTKVAWTPDLGLPVDAEVRTALAFVPDQLVALGNDVEETMPDLREAGEIFQTLRAWHFEISGGALYDRAPDQVKDTVAWNIEEARRRSLVDHARASVGHAELIARIRRFFDRYDVLALPTSQVVPFDVDLDWPREVDGRPMDTYIDWMRTCSDITLTGCPAISMPAAFTPGGLPVGVQFVGRPRGDVELLRFARRWERAVSPTRATVVDS